MIDLFNLDYNIKQQIAVGLLLLAIVQLFILGKLVGKSKKYRIK